MPLPVVSNAKFLPKNLQLAFVINAKPPTWLKAKKVVSVTNPDSVWNKTVPLSRADIIVLGPTKLSDQQLIEKVQHYSHEAGCVWTGDNTALAKKFEAAGFVDRGNGLLQKPSGTTPEEYGQGYIDRWGENDWMANADLAASQILAHLRPGMKKSTIKVIDVGCLNGYIMESVHRAGVPNTYGTDISYFLAVEKNLNPESLINITVGDFSQNSYPDQSFDVVICMEVLEHIPPALTQTFVRELARIAKRDGILLLSTSEDWFADDTHINCRNRAEWYAIFACYGLIAEGSQVIFPGFNSFVVRPTHGLENLVNRLTTAIRLLRTGHLKRPEGR